MTQPQPLELDERRAAGAPLHPLVELARSALDRLAEVPRFGEASRGSAARLERAWVRAPLIVAIGGAVSARTALFNHVCGTKVLDPATRPLDSATLRVRRGSQTRFKAIRDDGTTEEHVLPREQADDEPLRLRAAGARVLLDERQLALQRVERSLPRAARARPRGLMIWLWPVWWLVTRRHRRVLAERRFSESAYDQARDALALADKELAASEARIRVERGRFFESLRALSSGPPLGTHVGEVELVLEDGPLPAGVELVELGRPGTSMPAADAVFIVERDALHAPHSDAGGAPRVGTVEVSIPSLLALLGKTRAYSLACEARAELEPALNALDDDITSTEEGFRVRIERLEAMQVLDADELVRVELDKLRGLVERGARDVIEHAHALAASELATLGNEWSVAIASTPDVEHLKQAVQRIESSTALDVRRISEATRALIGRGAGRVLLELVPRLVAVLRPHGLDEPPPQTPPALPSLEVLGALERVELAKLAGLLTGLFRSFESRRSDVLAKTGVRIVLLREAARSELAAAEPVLRAALEQVLDRELRAAIGRQAAWLDRTLAGEREAVTREGLALAPLARVRNELRRDLDSLAAGITQIERESPGLVAAGMAATSSAR